MKRILTPFTRQSAGSLTSRPHVEDKKDGGDKGFKPAEYVYAPAKNGQHYISTQLLSQLRTPDDQLYINGHCSKGLNYLANMEDCKAPGAHKVEMDDLVLQLKAHGLPLETEAKIKLWICEGALDDGGEKSFAQRFQSP
jgi:hypothetical protein